MLKFQWRSSNLSGIMTQGIADELKEIKRRLQEDGLDPTATDEQKLRHLWQLYLKTEGSLKGSLASIEELRTQQAEEMREVENYVEHIRSLSDEREALTLEFEAENEQLKADIVRLTNALEGFKSDEIKDMLLQQNLDEIASGTTSEQIAYLLVERARLMDELEAEEARSTVQTPEGAMTAGQLLLLLEQERVEFEEELAQQRDSLRGVKQTMRQAHEEEITTLIAENEKLQDMLDSAKLQTGQMTQEVEDLRQQIKDQQAALLENSSTHEEMQIERSARNQYQQEAELLKERVEELEDDNKTLIENAVTLNSQLQESRDELENLRQSAVVNHRSKTGRTLEELEEENKRMVGEIDNLQLKLDLAMQESEDLRNQTITNISTGEDVQTRMRLKMIETINERMRKEIADLKNQNQAVSHELEEVKRQQAEERWNAAKATPGGSTQGSPFGHQRDTANTEALKTKIRHLETKVSSLEGDLATSQRELWSQQADFKKDDRGEHKANAATEVKLKEVTDRLEAVVTEKDDLYNVLETQRQQNSSLRREMASNMDRISSLEASSYHLQAENTELQTKLTDVQQTITTLEGHMKEDSTKGDEQREKDNKEMQEAQSAICGLKKEIEQLNAQLERSQSDLQQAEVKATSEKKHYEIEVDDLKLEIGRLHTNHQEELASLSQRLDQTYKDITTLKNSINNRDEELNELEKETSSLRRSEASLTNRLDIETQRRHQFELSNASLQQESDKAWSQIKEMSIKISSLETTNQNLRMELDRKTQTFREAENLLTLRSTDQKSLLGSAQQRAEDAEKKLYELQKELESTLSKLQSTENQLRQSKALRTELQEKREEILRLREELQEEKIQKSFVSHGTEDLTTQITLLREKERAAVAQSHELQHMLLDVESKLDLMKDQTQETTTKHQVEDVGKQSLIEQVTRMQRDVETLQSELAATTDRYDMQVRKYNERKMRTKNKLQKARELFHTERNKYRGEVERLTEQLSVAQMSLVRETEWKDQIEQNYKKLMVDKRDLLTQVAEQEETVHDQSRSLSVLQVRTRYLEEENQNLQTRIESLSKQKHNLDRLIKEYQLERHKEALDTMSPDVDALMSPRISSPLVAPPSGATSALAPPVVQTPLVDALTSPRVSSPLPMTSRFHGNVTSVRWGVDAVPL